MRRALLALALGVALGAPAAARAEDQPAQGMDAKPTRRNGFLIGTSGGFGLSSVVGYPNGARFIDNPDFRSETGAMLASGGQVFIMGALTDYLNFGFFMGGGSAQNEDFKESRAGGGIRADVFPFFYAVPALRDLGFRAAFGVGGTSLEIKRPGSWPNADGTQSLIGLGVFHETLRLDGLGGHFVFCPTLDYDLITSRSATGHSLGLGARIAWYGGP
jgi:hypothetical protein